MKEEEEERKVLRGHLQTRLVSVVCFVLFFVLTG